MPGAGVTIDSVACAPRVTWSTSTALLKYTREGKQLDCPEVSQSCSIIGRHHAASASKRLALTRR